MLFFKRIRQEVPTEEKTDVIEGMVWYNDLTKSSKSPASIAKNNKQWVGTYLYQEECKFFLINCGAVIWL